MQFKEQRDERNSLYLKYLRKLHFVYAQMTALCGIFLAMDLPHIILRSKNFFITLRMRLFLLIHLCFYFIRRYLQSVIKLT